MSPSALPSIVVCDSLKRTSTTPTPTPTVVRRVDLCREDGSSASDSAGVDDNDFVNREATPMKKSGNDTVGTAAETEEESSIVAPRPSRKSLPDELVVEERDELAAKFVGRVIGKGGEMIRDLQARTATRIDVNQNVAEGEPRIITYRGRPDDIEFARRCVDKICREEGKHTQLPLGHAIKKDIMVPSPAIGKIIGKNGEMIRELQSKSQARIQIDHSRHGVAAHKRMVSITGDYQSVTSAVEMITYLCHNPTMDSMEVLRRMLAREKNGGEPLVTPRSYNLTTFVHPPASLPSAFTPTSPAMSVCSHGMGLLPSDLFNTPSDMPLYNESSTGFANCQHHQLSDETSAVETVTISFPQTKLERIIDPHGIIVNDIQKRSHCDINVKEDWQEGQDCDITITGPREGVQMARQMIKEIELGVQYSYNAAVGGYANDGYYSFNPYHYVDHTYTQHHDFYASSGIPDYSYQPDSYYQRGATYYHSYYQVTPEKQR